MLSWRRLFYSILQFLKSLLFTLFPSLDKENVKGKGDTACVIPESVNYHFTRQCNYNCEEINIKLEPLYRNNFGSFRWIGGFCFHTAKTSYHLPLDDAKKGLAMLKEAGMKKVNFSGGEPFLIQGGHYKTYIYLKCKNLKH